MSNRVFIIGNGESRARFDLSCMEGKGLIYGCNALHRDYMLREGRNYLKSVIKLILSLMLLSCTSEYPGEKLITRSELSESSIRLLDSMDDLQDLIQLKTEIIRKENDQLILELVSLQFEKDFKSPDCPVSIEEHYGFKRPDGSIANGHWDPYTGSIYINMEAWRSLSFIHKKELLYHEYGHCTLNLGHIKTPGIMRGKIFDAKENGLNWKWMVEAMKEQCKKKGSC